MDISLTTRFNTSYNHAKFREPIDTLWESKKKHLDFRLFKTSGFSRYGSGRTWLWIKKWGDTYVCGVRKWGLIEDHECPTNHFSGVPWAIIQRDRTILPGYADASRNNWLSAMGFWGLCQGRHWNHDIPVDAGIQLYGDANRTLISSGIELTDEGVTPYGSSIQDPEVQIYDRGLFNKGRQALLQARRYIEVYIKRHQVLEGGDPWRGWNDAFIKHLVQHFMTNELPPPPDEILEWWLNGRSSQWWGAKRVALPGQSSIRKSWKHIGVETGFCRIVPRGTPLYTEGLPFRPYEPNYDDIILAD